MTSRKAWLLKPAGSPIDEATIELDPALTPPLTGGREYHMRKRTVVTGLHIEGDYPAVARMAMDLKQGPLSCLSSPASLLMFMTVQILQAVARQDTLHAFHAGRGS